MAPPVLSIRLRPGARGLLSGWYASAARWGNGSSTREGTTPWERSKHSYRRRGRGAGSRAWAPPRPRHPMGRTAACRRVLPDRPGTFRDRVALPDLPAGLRVQGHTALERAVRKAKRPLALEPRSFSVSRLLLLPSYGLAVLLPARYLGILALIPIRDYTTIRLRWSFWGK